MSDFVDDTIDGLFAEVAAWRQRAAKAEAKLATTIGAMTRALGYSDFADPSRDGMDWTGPVPGWVKILRAALEKLAGAK